MTDILDFVVRDGVDRARTENGRYRLVLTGSVEGHINEQSKLTIFEATADDPTTRYYSPAVDFLPSADTEGPQPDTMLAYQCGIRQGFFILLNQLNLLDHGASMAQLQALAAGEGVPDATVVLADIAAWNAANANALDGVVLVDSAEAWENRVIRCPHQYKRFLPSFEAYCQAGQQVMPTFRLSEVEVVGPDWQVPNELFNRWTHQQSREYCMRGLADIGPIVEGLGAHRLRTCGSGGGHSWMTNLDHNIAAAETEAALKAARSPTRLQQVTGMLRDCLHPVRNMEGIYLMLVLSQARVVLLQVW